MKMAKHWQTAGKRALAGFLGTALAFAGNPIGPTNAYAAEHSMSSFLTVGEAIQAAGSFVHLGDDCMLTRAVFLRENNDYRDQPVWKLQWEDAEKFRLTIHLDAASGKLLYYEVSYGDEQGSPVSKEAALETAKRFVEQAVSPQERSKLSGANAFGRLQPYHHYGEDGYVFTFTRIENQIPFPEDGCEVIVGRNGEVKEFYREWHEGELPRAAKLIPEKEARALFGEKATPILLNKDLSSITMSYAAPKTDAYRLVYAYREMDPQMVDAVTGQVLNARGEPPAEKRIQPLGRNIRGDRGAPKTITKEEAQKIAAQSLPSPERYQVTGSEQGEKQWKFTFTPRGDGKHQPEATTVVISRQGDVLEFANPGAVTGAPEKEEGVPYALAALRAGKLVQTFYNDRSGEIYAIEGTPSDKDTKRHLETGTLYQITFGWLQDGVPVEGKTIEVLVDVKTGQPVYLNARGSEQSPQNALPKEAVIEPSAAQRIELENRTFALTYYASVYSPEKILLVYRSIGEEGVVDAQTGKWLNFGQMWREARANAMATATEKGTGR